jgi:hypothetical protein
MESGEAIRLKNRAEEILVNLYGLFKVWDVKITSFTPSNDKFKIEGSFFEDFGRTKEHRFTILLDRYGRLHDYKVT